MYQYKGIPKNVDYVHAFEIEVGEDGDLCAVLITCPEMYEFSLYNGEEHLQEAEKNMTPWERSLVSSEIVWILNGGLERE